MALLLTALPASAATINVDSTCSLAQAIKEANGDTTGVGSCEAGTNGSGAAGHDRIVLPSSQTYTISAAYPDFTSHITIDGKGSVINGGDATSFFKTGSGSNVTLQNMTLTNGFSAADGNIYHLSGSLTLRSVIFKNSNHTALNKGLIWANSDLTVENSLFHSNHGRTGTTNFGKNIFMSEGNLTITNSAFVDNNTNGHSVDVYIGYGSVKPTISITNSTFTGSNKGISISSNGAVRAPRSDLRHLTVKNGLRFGRGTHSLRNSILYGAAADCSLIDSGSLSTNTGNIIGNNSCGGSPLTSNPQLPSSLTSSGTLRYFALADGSPAIDGADCITGVSVDQRGTARPQGAKCDIGAYEHVPPPTNTPAPLPTQTSAPQPTDTQQPTATTLPNTPTSTPRPTYTPPPEVRASRPRGQSGSGADPYQHLAAAPPPPATPTLSSCEALPLHIEVTGRASSTECREVAGMHIGDDALIPQATAAVDIWSWVLPDTKVCFRGDGGAIRFIDTQALPRQTSELETFADGGMVCGMVDGPGIAVLVEGGSAPQASAALQAQGRGLSGCMVTTTHILNFRAGPGGDIEGILPAFVTLTAEARTDGWIQVDFHGRKGWISADFAQTDGNCG